MERRESRFLKACRREPTDCTPIWFMRQAGRYLPEYRAIREDHSILDICKTPELSARVTLLPIARLKVDAAILFADILLPLEPMGISFHFEEGTGPVIHNPVRDEAAVRSLRPLQPEEGVPFVLETIRILREDLEVPLIGFAGAPFTLASYLIEGGPSRAFSRTKGLMYGEPATWHSLMEKLTDAVLAYLTGQVEAGAQAVQLFDSWVGALSPTDYEEFALPYSQRIFSGLKETAVPTIHFGTGTATLLEAMARAGGDVIGVDWRVPLDEAWTRIGGGRAVQGNLDPAVLLGPVERIQAAASAILARADGRPGHIFNLGHGILPGTPVEHARALVELVHTHTQRGAD